MQDSNLLSRQSGVSETGSLHRALVLCAISGMDNCPLMCACSFQIYLSLFHVMQIKMQIKTTRRWTHQTQFVAYALSPTLPSSGDSRRPPRKLQGHQI